MEGRTVEWTPHESALWRTCEIVAGLVRRGEPPEPMRVSFAHQLGVDERIFATSDYQRGWYGAGGDGSYRTSTFVAGGFSPLGVVLGAATLGASIAGNSARKANARRAAEQRWRTFDVGQIYVSTHGFYLLPSTGGVLAFGLSSLLQVDLGAPGVLVADISMDSGSQEQFAITTVWAELLFVLWARDYCPNHPRLERLGFLPQEFLARVEYAGVWDASPMRELVGG